MGTQRAAAATGTLLEMTDTTYAPEPRQAEEPPGDAHSAAEGALGDEAARRELDGGEPKDRTPSGEVPRDKSHAGSPDGQPSERDPRATGDAGVPGGATVLGHPIDDASTRASFDKQYAGMAPGYAPTVSHDAEPPGGGGTAPAFAKPKEDWGDPELNASFAQLVNGDDVSWRIDYQLVREIGSGGQGRVFLVDRIGSYGSHFRMALKFFRPDCYPRAVDYHLDMARLARVSMRIARLQHDSLLDVFNVVDIDGVQVLAMEWVDGYDLRQLLDAQTLDRTQQRVPGWRFEYLKDVVVTYGETEEDSGLELASSRLQPGVAVAITRECLSGLGALHRAGIVHADVKPANIMVKKTGSSKLIDVGSSFTLDDPPQRTSWTPRYAAVEVLSGQRPTAASDLASLGYTLVEILSGGLPWDDSTSVPELIEIKRYLPGQLDRLLPEACVEDRMFVSFVRRLIATDPAERFDSAEAADFDDDGAAGFHRRLVKGDLDSEYKNELRLWLSELGNRAAGES